MLSFRCIIAGVTLIAAPVIAALTPAALADGLGQLMTKTQALNDPANSITILNAPLIVIGQGPFPQIIAGLDDITSTASTLTAQTAGMPTIPAGSDALLVFNAFRQFHHTLENLLNILTGKAGILEKIVVVGQPVANALGALKNAVDGLILALGTVDPTEAPTIMGLAEAIDGALELCISKYESIANV